MRLLWMACLATLIFACDDYHHYTVSGRVLDPDGGGVGGVQVVCHLAAFPNGSGYEDNWHPTTLGALCAVDGGCAVPADAGVGDFSCTVDALNVNSSDPQALTVTANPLDGGPRDVRFGFVSVQVQTPDQGTATTNLSLPAAH